MDKGRKDSKKIEKRTVGKIIKIILKLFLFLFLLTLAVGIFYGYNRYGKVIIKLQEEARNIARSSSEEIFRSSQTSIVYDNDGELIATLRGVKDVYYIDYMIFHPLY